MCKKDQNVVYKSFKKKKTVIGGKSINKLIKLEYEKLY